MFTLASACGEARVIEALCLTLTVLLAGYLLFALLVPERF
jgi:K+-transporting ATPase KdpF subunit